MAVKMRADSGQGSQRRAETLLSKKKGTRLEGRKENSRENIRRGQYREFKRKQAHHYQRERSGTEVSREL